MTEPMRRIALIAAAVLGPLLLTYLAYSQPGYFTSEQYLGGLLLLEFLAVAVWMYRKVFFPLIIVAFLLAGVDLPVGRVWAAARWVFLCVGAVVGAVIVFRERRHHFGAFHIVALFAILATLVSAAVSQFPSVTLLKALSVLLLFLYGSTGARLAVTGRENRFFVGLLTGCEVFVGALAVLYAVGVGAMGNPNSLGAVMGVVGAPILLWGTLASEKSSDRNRRMVLFVIALYLTYASHARAGMVAAVLASALLLLPLRKYTLLAKGVTIVTILVSASAVLQPENFSNAVSSVMSSVVYKGVSEGGLLASRQSPWQAAVDNITKHPWFGIGLGTTNNSDAANVRVGMFSSSTAVTAENGSSYLSILAGVGVFGAIPFLLLLLMLLEKIVRTVVWMVRTRSANHPAVPIAAVLVAGLFHAAFEDWLFAPGYHLCVLFWSLAFIFVDVAPSSIPRAAVAWRFREVQRDFGDSHAKPATKFS
jgi:O-antigen ligase